jgi:hypothetical protein
LIRTSPRPLNEFAGVTVRSRTHTFLAILVVAGAILSSGGSAFAQSSREVQAECELSAIRDTRSALAIQLIRSACNWLALNGGSSLHESGKNYNNCLVQRLSGVQADEAAGAILSACRTSNPL